MAAASGGETPEADEDEEAETIELFANFQYTLAKDGKEEQIKQNIVTKYVKSCPKEIKSILQQQLKSSECSITWKTGEVKWDIACKEDFMTIMAFTNEKYLNKITDILRAKDQSNTLQGIKVHLSIQKDSLSETETHFAIRGEYSQEISPTTLPGTPAVDEVGKVSAKTLRPNKPVKWQREFYLCVPRSDFEKVEVHIKPQVKRGKQPKKKFDMNRLDGYGSRYYQRLEKKCFDEPFKYRYVIIKHKKGFMVPEKVIKEYKWKMETPHQIVYDIFLETEDESVPVNDGVKCLLAEQTIRVSDLQQFQKAIECFGGTHFKEHYLTKLVTPENVFEYICANEDLTNSYQFVFIMYLLSPYMMQYLSNDPPTLNIEKEKVLTGFLMCLLSFEFPDHIGFAVPAFYDACYFQQHKQKASIFDFVACLTNCISDEVFCQHLKHRNWITNDEIELASKTEFFMNLSQTTSKRRFEAILELIFQNIEKLENLAKILENVTKSSIVELRKNYILCHIKTAAERILKTFSLNLALESEAEFSELSECMSSIMQFEIGENASNEVCSNIETKLIESITRTNWDNCKLITMKGVISSHLLFMSTNSQSELLEEIPRVESVLFVEDMSKCILSLEKISQIDENNVRIFCESCLRFVRSQSDLVAPTMARLCEFAFELCRTKYSSARITIQNHIVQTVESYIYSLKQFGDLIKTIDDCSSLTDVLTTYQKTFQKAILLQWKKMKTKGSFAEILRAYIDIEETLTIDSRGCTEVLLVILTDAIHALQDDHNLSDVLAEHQFWNMILTCKGKYSKELHDHAATIQVCGLLSNFVEAILHGSVNTAIVFQLSDLGFFYEDRPNLLLIALIKHGSKTDQYDELRKVLEHSFLSLNERQKELNDAKEVINYMKYILELIQEFDLSQTIQVLDVFLTKISSALEELISEEQTLSCQGFNKLQLDEEILELRRYIKPCHAASPSFTSFVLYRAKTTIKGVLEEPLDSRIRKPEFMNSPTESSELPQQSKVYKDYIKTGVLDLTIQSIPVHDFDTRASIEKHSAWALQSRYHQHGGLEKRNVLANRKEDGKERNEEYEEVVEVEAKKAKKEKEDSEEKEEEEKEEVAGTQTSGDSACDGSNKHQIYLRLDTDEDIVWAPSMIELARFIFDVCYKEYIHEICELLGSSSVCKVKEVRRFMEVGLTIDEYEMLKDQYKTKAIDKRLFSGMVLLQQIEDLKERAKTFMDFFNSLGLHSSCESTIERCSRYLLQLDNVSLEEQNLSEFTQQLQLFYDATQFCNQNRCEWDIIQEIALHPDVAAFTRQIVPDEVSSLIYSVEECSEGSLPASTIDGFIKVFNIIFHPLKCATTIESAIQFISNIDEKTKQESASDLVNIAKCLHRIKSLHNHGSHKSDLNKDKISQIIRQSKAVFEVQDSVCSLEIHENEVLSQSDFNDLLSWARLVHSREEDDSTNENLQFLEVAILLFDIREKMEFLHVNGHFDFQTCRREIKIDKSESVTSTLKEIKLFYIKTCEQWLNEVKRGRKTYFYMNFILPQQLTTVLRYLNESDLSERDCDAYEKGNSILKFINKTYDASVKVVQGISTNDISELLAFIGKNLEKLLNVRVPRKALNAKVKAQALPKEEDNVFLIQLAMNAKVIPTIIGLYASTRNELPLPNEIIFCKPETAWEELDLFLDRLSTKYVYKQNSLCCIAFIENLGIEIQEKLAEIAVAINLTKGSRLVLIMRAQSDNVVVQTFEKRIHYADEMTRKEIEQCFKCVSPHVKVFTSDLTGQGKTELIHQEAAKIGKNIHTVLISGEVSNSILVESIPKLMNDEVLHLDLGEVYNPEQLDLFLFELFIIGCARAPTCYIHYNDEPIFIEIANTMNERLKNNLLVASHFNNVHIKRRTDEKFTCIAKYMPSLEPNSPIQIVCKYLQYVDTDDHNLDRNDIDIEGPPISVDNCRHVLQNFLGKGDNVSYYIIEVFINVLAVQLKRMSASPVFQVQMLSSMGIKPTDGLRSSIIKYLTDMAQDFAKRSVQSSKRLQLASINKTKAVESAQRTEGMVRWNDLKHVLLLFNEQDRSTITPVYDTTANIPKTITEFLERQLFNRKDKSMRDMSKLQQEELLYLLQHFVSTTSIHVNEINLGRYVLTPDNVMKMILISLRRSSRVPIILMGETGCGKTSLITFLANVCKCTLKILTLHSGITKTNIRNFVMSCFPKSVDKTNETWLFLDEINTSPHIAYINDILCHRNCEGETLPGNVVLLAACNPYRLRTKDEIQTSGLPEKRLVDALAQLVYRVHPLPETMFEFVWDFGDLHQTDERRYISQMLNFVFVDAKETKQNIVQDDQILELLCHSQCFFRTHKGLNRYVSLRDVSRCCKLFNWFLKEIQQKHKLKQKQNISFYSCSVDAVVLSLCHSYGLKLQQHAERHKYYARIATILFRSEADEHVNKIKQIIADDQNDILSRMAIEPSIARNHALRENIHALFVSIMNKIPIFLIGKPGSSKSLSLRLLQSNLKGKDSDDEYFKTLPLLHFITFQGSEASTADSVEKVFENAQKYYEYLKNSGETDNEMVVVLLDEIGLAERSNDNPLKVLHSRLDPIVTVDKPHETVHSEQSYGKQEDLDIAVVGVSNYALDSAKMNRVVHVSRPDLDVNELTVTAKAICGPKSKVLEGLLQKLATAYCEYVFRQKNDAFHGLRDYYELMKYISKRIDSEENIAVIYHGLLRNFGGVDSKNAPVKELLKQIDDKYPQVCVPIVSLIRENITDNESRYLLLIVKNMLMFPLLKTMLGQVEGKRFEVIMGSRFTSDQRNDYYFDVLRHIIYSMQFEDVLILQNLDSVYDSLYDMLNRNYTKDANNQTCRVAIGAVCNNWCKVHPNFRCVVIMEENEALCADPPFLNRFEKQFVNLDNLLSQKQMLFKAALQNQIDEFCTIDIPVPGAISSEEAVGYSAKHLVYHTFIGLQEETLASIVMKMAQDGELELDKPDGRLISTTVLQLAIPEAIFALPRSKLSQDIASELRQEYIALPIHYGLQYFIKCSWNRFRKRKFTIYTRSQLLTNISYLCQNAQVVRMSNVLSEKQLRSYINEFCYSNTPILIVQCSVRLDIEHIPLLKQLIDEKDLGEKIICIVIHITKSKAYLNQLSFIHSDDWDSVLLDQLEKDTHGLPELNGRDKLFFVKEEICVVTEIVRNYMAWAFTEVQFEVQNKNKHVECLQSLIKHVIANNAVLNEISKHVRGLITKEWVHKIQKHDRNHWQVIVACDANRMRGNSLKEAWKEHILDLIKTRLATLVLFIAKYSAWENSLVTDETFYGIWCEIMRSCATTKALNDCYKQKQQIWVKWFDHSLKFPFSQIILEQMDLSFIPFLHELTSDEHQTEREVIADDPCDVQMKYGQKVRSLLSSICPVKVCINQHRHELFNDVLLHFCYQHTSRIETGVKVRIFKYILGDLCNIETASDMMTNVYMTYARAKEKLDALFEFVARGNAFTITAIEDLTDRKQDEHQNIETRFNCFVKEICEHLIKNILKTHSGTAVLEVKDDPISLALMYCSQLSLNTPEVHYLRFYLDVKYMDIGEDVKSNIISYISQDVKLNITNKNFLNGIKDLTNIKVDCRNRNKILSKLYIRCLDTESNENCVDLILNEIAQESEMHHFTIVLDCIFAQLNIDLEALVIGNDEIINSNSTLYILNELISKHSKLPFCTMLCDVIEKSVKRNSKCIQIKTGIEALRVTSGGVKDVLSLKDVVCIAFSRVFVCEITDLDKWVEMAVHEQKDVNLYLRSNKTDSNELEISPLIGLLMKTHHSGSMKELRRKIDKIHHIKCVDDIDWPDQVQCGFRYNFVIDQKQINHHSKFHPKSIHLLEQSRAAILADGANSKVDAFNILVSVAEYYFWSRFTESPPSLHGCVTSFYTDTENEISKLYAKVLAGLFGIRPFQLKWLRITESSDDKHIYYASVIVNVLLQIVTFNISPFAKRFHLLCEAFEHPKATLMHHHFETIPIFPEVDVETNAHFVSFSNDSFEVVRPSFNAEHDLNMYESLFASQPCIDILQILCNIICKICVIGSKAIGICDEKDVETQFEEEWQYLSETLEMNDKVLSELINHAVEIIFNQEINSMSDMSDLLKQELAKYETVEAKLNEIKVDKLKNNLIDTAKLENQLEDIQSSNTEAVKKTEVVKILLARYVRSPTINHLFGQACLICHIKPRHFRFLKLCCEWTNRLEMLKHFVPILKFLSLLRNTVEYKLSQEECSRETITAFFKGKDKGDRTIVQAFLKSWKYLHEFVSKNKAYKTTKNKFMDGKTKLCCFIPSSNDHPIMNMLRFLAKIQNDFLSLSAEVALTDYKPLEFMRFGVQVEISKTSLLTVSQKVLAIPQWDPETFLDYSENFTDDGYGNIIKYDFECIERCLAMWMLLGKKWINTNTTFDSFVFKGEVFQKKNRIIAQIKESVQQHPIDETLKQRLSVYKDDELSITPLFSYLETILSFAVSSKPEEFITDVAVKWSVSDSEIDDDIRLCFSNKVQMCHFVELYEYIEEAVSEKRLECLTQTGRITPDQKSTLKSFLNETSSKWLLFALARFASRFLQTGYSSSSIVVQDSILKDILFDKKFDLWPSNVADIDDLENQFPDTITVEATKSVAEFVKTEYSEKPTFQLRGLSNLKSRSQLGRRKKKMI